MPFFSVIITTYNRKSFLSIAIESVLRQSFGDFELLIIDDGSTDDTRSLCKGIDDKRLRYIHQPHKGVACARNRGVKKAKSAYICFLDSDDRFIQQKLEVTYNYIKKYPDYKIFHTEELWYRNGAILPQKKGHKKPDGYVFKEALKKCSISISCACVHKDIFKETGLFDESMHACEDYEFWVRVTAQYPVKLIPKVLTLKEGGHADQLSKKYEAMDTLRIYAIEKILKSGSLSPAAARAAAAELQKKCEIYIKGAAKRNKTKEVRYYKDLVERAHRYVG